MHRARVKAAADGVDVRRRRGVGGGAATTDDSQKSRRSPMVERAASAGAAASPPSSPPSRPSSTMLPSGSITEGRAIRGAPRRREIAQYRSDPRSSLRSKAASRSCRKASAGHAGPGRAPPRWRQARPTACAGAAPRRRAAGDQRDETPAHPPQSLRRRGAREGVARAAALAREHAVVRAVNRARASGRRAARCAARSRRRG